MSFAQDTLCGVPLTSSPLVRLPSLPPVPLPPPNPLSPPPACATGPCSRGVSAATLTFPARGAPAREVAPGGGAPRSSTGPVAAQCLRLCNTEWWGGNGVADWLPISEEKRQLLDQIRIYLLLTLFLEYSSSSLVSLQSVKLARRCATRWLDPLHHKTLYLKWYWEYTKLHSRIPNWSFISSISYLFHISKCRNTLQLCSTQHHVFALLCYIAIYSLHGLLFSNN